MPDHPQGELAREQAYLAHARRELARMREHTLGMPASGGDRVSAEFLAATLHRRAAQLVDDPTTALFFGRLDLEHPEHHVGGAGPPDVTRSAEPTERWYVGRRHVNNAATRSSSTGAPTCPERSTGPRRPTRWGYGCVAGSGSTAAG